MSVGVDNRRSLAVENHRAVVLLLSLLVYLVLSPLLEKDNVGKGILVVSMFVTLVAAALELSVKRQWQWLTILLTGGSMLVNTAAYLNPVRPLVIAGWLLTAVFFGVVSMVLFLHLGQRGPVTTARLLVSVSLYLLLAMFWFALYNLLEAIHPGSFAQQSGAASGPLPRSALLYLSIVTQTTLGYGDVLPITPIARMVAALESAAGVLYIAITVARLVTAYGTSDRQQS